jgi:hypothetical protein
MKKILFISALSILTCAVRAQVHADFGIKGGLNLANMKFESSSTPDSKMGIHLGALAHLHFQPHWAFQPELVYSDQGATETISGTEYKLKLHYVNVPLLLQYMTGSGFRIQTGPQLGILAGAKSKAGGTEVDYDYAYKTFDVAWAFGGSYVTDRGFGLDVRYNLGLSDINDNGGGSIKNRVWQFGVFYQFKVASNAHRHIK